MNRRVGCGATALGALACGDRSPISPSIRWITHTPPSRRAIDHRAGLPSGPARSARLSGNENQHRQRRVLTGQRLAALQPGATVCD